MKVNSRSLKKLITWSLKIVLLFLLFSITASIVLVSIRYFFPDFERGFLAGKEALFRGIFPFGLYVHVISAPLLIVISSLLVFFRLEYKFPKTHRFLGKAVVFTGFLLFIPSSFILAAFALGGWKGILLFNILSLLSAVSLCLAYYFARKRSIAKHRKWMLRFYIFLLSAIFLRINKFIFGYYFDYFGIESYLLSALLSWLPQWVLLELCFAYKAFKMKPFSIM